MTNRNRPPRSGGAAIALLGIAGVVIGSIYRQPSIGLLAGVCAGAAIAIALWIVDSRRR